MIPLIICNRGVSQRRFSMCSKAMAMIQDAFIMSGARTPIGSFKSKLASMPATELGSIAIMGAIERGRIATNAIQEVFMGQVITANAGQAPARQAALGAGLERSVAATTLNKVCASGLKAIMLAAQTIQLGHQQVAIGGGMESMSRAPFYIERGEPKYGGFTVSDGVYTDGLCDAYEKKAMGLCGDKTAKEYDISRDQQDEFAIKSYKLSAAAWEQGLYTEEIIPVMVKTKKGTETVSEDEEYKRFSVDKLKKLKPAFSADGTVTAGNASTLNDAAAAVIVASEKAARDAGTEPVARILSFGDAATEPLDFCLAPSLVIPKILQRANLKISDIDLFEINEAFAVVPLVTMKKLPEIDPEKMNVHGGAISLGHPIGMSGTRLVVHLIHALQSGQKGLVAICNGGGGAAGMIIEKL